MTPAALCFEYRRQLGTTMIVCGLIAMGWAVAAQRQAWLYISQANL